MYTYLKKIISPPIYSNANESRKACIIHMLALAIIIIEIGYSAVFIIVNPNPTKSLLFNVAIIAIALFLLFLNYRHVQMASYLFVLVTWVSVVLSAIMFGGIRGANFTSFTLVILITGLLLGSRAAVIATFITILSAFLLYFAELNGWFQANEFALSLENTLGGQIFNFLLVALLFYLAVTDLNRALATAQNSKQALTEAINESTILLTSALDLEQVLNSILALLTRVVRYDSASVFLIQGDKLHVVAGQGHPHPEQVVGQIFAFNSGVFAEISATKRPLYIKNVQDDSRFTHWNNEAHIRGWMGIPLIANNLLLGFLIIDSTQIDAYGQYETDLTATFANQAAIAILNAQLFQETQQQLDRQIALSRASQAITQSLDIELLLTQIAEQLGKIVGGTSAYITLIDLKTETMIVEAEYFSEQASEKEKISDLGQTYTFAELSVPSAELFVKPITVHVDDDTLGAQHLAEYGAITRLLIPIRFQNELIAYAEVWESRYRRIFTDEEVAFCENIAFRAAAAIRNSQLFIASTRRLKEQTALREAMTAITKSLDLSVVLHQIAEQLGKVIEATSTYICSFEQETMTSIVLAEYLSEHASDSECVSDLGAEYNIRTELPAIHETYQTRRPAIRHVHDPKLGAITKAHYETYDAKSSLVVPLIYQNELIAFAVLWESRQIRPFTAEEITICSDIAQQATIALINAQLYERVQNQAQTLENKVQKRTSELVEANKKLQTYTQDLERSNHELEAFAYVASHDLQEPLRKIQTFSDRISERYAAQLDDRGQDYLRRMNTAAYRMQSLIIDLLTYSRIATREQPFQQISLNYIVQEVLNDLSTHIEENKGQISVQKLPHIEADATQMRQLFQNLLSNSLKFHQPDQPPIVQIYSTSLANNTAQIIIEDNGIGFDEKYLSRIFEVFQRLHGRTRYPGTGVGLAICRKIVLRHQGTITAQSQPNKGAKFIITLPHTQN